MRVHLLVLGGLHHCGDALAKGVQRLLVHLLEPVEQVVHHGLLVRLLPADGMIHQGSKAACHNLQLTVATLILTASFAADMNIP